MIRALLLTALLLPSTASAQFDLDDGPASQRLYGGALSGIGGAMLAAAWLGGPVAISDACGFEPECGDAMGLAYIPLAGSWIAMGVGTEASEATAAIMGVMQLGGAALLVIGTLLWWSGDQMEAQGESVTIVPTYVDGGAMILTGWRG